MALGFQALVVARVALDGDCQKLGESVQPNTGVFFAVETLEFLQRGGRLGAHSGCWARRGT